MVNPIMIVDILIINQLSKDHIYDNWKKIKELHLGGTQMNLES